MFPVATAATDVSLGVETRGPSSSQDPTSFDNPSSRSLSLGTFPKLDELLESLVLHVRLTASKALIRFLASRFMDRIPDRLQKPHVHFVNVNLAGPDPHKNGAVTLRGDARATLEQLGQLLQGWSVDSAYCQRVARLNP